MAMAALALRSRPSLPHLSSTLTAIIAILSPCRREQRAGRANGGGALAANGGAPSGMGEAGQLGMGSLQVPGLSGGGISGLGFSGLM